MSLLQTLSSLSPQPDQRALVGFDGYVDKIQRVVQSKVATGNQHFPTISSFATQVASLAGNSGQIELSTLETKIGGNGPILANALAAMGVTNRCVGTLADPIFGQMHPGCEVISVGPSAETNALEFGDGKVILSEVSVFERLNWPFMVDTLGLGTLQHHYADSQLFAFVDWANLTHGNDLWAGYLEAIVKPVTRTNVPIFFFDLCDPSKRSAADVQEALRIVAGYVPYGRVTLGMNENEARRIYLALHHHSPGDGFLLPQTPDLPTIATTIQQQTGIPNVLIHPTAYALVVTPDGLFQREGRLVPKPKVLTGGGDNLNAGYCFGLLNGFSPADCLTLGMATSGAYIENGHSPSVQELAEYVANWFSGGAV
jgi:hypothetical protein